MLIAVYGTLKRDRGNNPVLGNSVFITEGYIKGHRMFQSGIPFVVKDASSPYNVHVEVYNVPSEQVPRVDSLEGHPDWYRREETVVHTDSGQLIAYVYKVPEPPVYTEENLSGVF